LALAGTLRYEVVHWLGDTETVRVIDAPTVFGFPVSYTLRHEQANRRLLLNITDTPPGVSYVVPCRFGNDGVRTARLLADLVESSA
jgi:hypothetical protein